MRSNRLQTRAAIAFAAVVLSALFAAGAAEGAPLVTLQCGQTVTQSVRLANDLTDCPGDGLIIGAAGITLDLNGHTVDGTVAQTSDCNQPPSGVHGIENPSFDGVTIENGVVQQFAEGVGGGSETTSVSDNVWRDLTVRDNRFSGMGMGSRGVVFNDNRIVDNVASGNGCGFGIVANTTHGTYVGHNQVDGGSSGILICCSDHNVVEHNRVTGTEHDAVVVCCADGGHNIVRYNTITGAAEGGLVLCCGDGDQNTLVAHNTIAHNRTGGIEIEVGGNTVVANDVYSNGDGIAFGGDRNVVTDNRVSDAVGCPDGCGFGISFEGGSDDVIARNLVTGTLRDGIRIESFAVFGAPSAVDTMVRDNHVTNAGVDGFSAGTEVGGPISGLLFQGNQARRSGDDGFDVRSVDTTLTANRALQNGDFGIDAVEGVTDGGGNLAAGNGNPLQCNNLLCR